MVHLFSKLKSEKVTPELMERKSHEEAKSSLQMDHLPALLCCKWDDLDATNRGIGAGSNNCMRIFMLILPRKRMTWEMSTQSI